MVWPTNNKPVIGGVPEGNRRDHNIVRVSSFASKELSWHERRCIVLVVPVGCSLNGDSSLPFYRGYHLLIYPSSQNTSVTILGLMSMLCNNAIAYKGSLLTSHGL